MAHVGMVKHQLSAARPPSTKDLALRPPCDGVYCMYPCVLQTVSSLCTASRMELELLLAEGIGLSPRYQLWDELYTVTYGNKIVACVFLKTVDLHGLKARYHEPDYFFDDDDECGCPDCETEAPTSSSAIWRW